ncbi:hypothetical protein LCGC14_0513880 [marine sediment metagenome]|uniref:DeoxyPurine in DNA protein A domain-containing protein n=1 Tax=marine sediment metagenome TaxID=412755 RepID=A0A0F9UM27_9ZZZZ
MVNHARHFERSFLSVNRLRTRRSDFEAQAWILDSGAFTEISQHGEFRTSPAEYAALIHRWHRCGRLEMAVCQDFMCEPFILEATGHTVAQHQQWTVERYDGLLALAPVPIMPVLQGWEAADYVAHARQYGARLTHGMRVGVGSVCKRNASPLAVRRILCAIMAERPDLRLHGFGLKSTALRDPLIRALLHSADSMAWSYAARRSGGNANGLAEALAFSEAIEELSVDSSSQVPLLT